MGEEMEAALSSGWVESVSDLGDDAPVPGFDRPVLQVASMRLVPSKREGAQCVVRLSDGVHCLEGMLVPELNHLVIDRVLRAGTVLRVLEYLCSTRRNSRFVIVMQAEIIKVQSAQIGRPRLYEKLESKSERSISKSVTNTDQPYCESYSGGLGVTSPCTASRTVSVANNLAYNRACCASHSAQHGMARSSIASMAEPFILKMVAQIKDENSRFSDKQDSIFVKAILSYISTENFCYKACPLVVNGRQCNAKLSVNADGTWHCEKCRRNFKSTHCNCRYVIVIQIKDCTGMICTLAFQEAGEDIFGRTAKELYLLKYEEQDHVQFDDIIYNVLFHQYLFKLKVERGECNGEQLMKCTVIRAGRVDPLTGSSEFDSSTANSTGFSDMKEQLQASNRDDAISLGGTNYLFSTDQFVQLQGNEYGAVSAAVPDAWSTCGFAGHNAQSCPSGMDRERHPEAEGFMGSFHDSSLLDFGLVSQTVQ